MGARPDPWSHNRIMRIIIQDDSYRDVINWRSLPLSFFPYGFDEIIDGSDDSESKAFDLMVEHDDNIAAVKAYIQEEKGIPFKKQKLLKKEGGVLKDGQTLLSLEIKEGCTIILRYAPITQIRVNHLGHRNIIRLGVEADDTIADVKAAIQEKEGIRFHQQRLLFRGRQPSNSETLVNCGVEYDSLLELVLRLCGC